MERKINLDTELEPYEVATILEKIGFDKVYYMEEIDEEIPFVKPSDLPCAINGDKIIYVEDLSELFDYVYDEGLKAGSEGIKKSIKNSLSFLFEL